MLAPEAGLLSGVDLEDAQRLGRAGLGALPEGLADFVDRSARQDGVRRQRGLLVASGLAVMMSILAVSAGLMAFSAHRNSVEVMNFLHAAIRSEEGDGDALSKAHDLDGAISAYQSSLASASRLLERQPANLQWRLDLAIEHARLGFVLRRRGAVGDAANSRAEFLLAQSLAADVARRDAANPQVRDDREAFQQQLAPLVGGLK